MKWPWYYFVAFFILISLCLNFFIHGEEQFTSLSQSFLQGKTYFSSPPALPGNWNDTSLFQGKHFWPLGPLPAILLIPFTYLFNRVGLTFYQGYFSFPLVLLTFWLVFRLARNYRFSKEDSLVWAYAFCFASAYLGVALRSWSWWFSHVVASVLVFLIINEYLQKKRFLLLGILFGSLLLTRVPAFLGILLILVDIVISKAPIRKRLLGASSLLFPVGISILLLGLYNYVRFHNFWEQGYWFQILHPSLLRTIHTFGLFNLIYLPTNLYFFLISIPQLILDPHYPNAPQFPILKANASGMGILVTSPYFLYLFLLKNTDRLSKMLLITSLVIATPIFLYYGIGYRQFGYRYSLDFLPFLFWLLVKNYREQKGTLSPAFKLIIILTSISNLYLFTTLFIQK